VTGTATGGEAGSGSRRTQGEVGALPAGSASSPSSAAAGEAGPLLVARGLAWQAGGRPIVGPLDLDVAAGACLVVVGPNGAGKTSLLRLLAGLLAPSAGTVSFRGRPLAGTPRREIARRIAYVPQIRPARVPLTVEEVVLLGRHPHLGRFQLAPAAADHAAVAAALARVGVEGLRARPLDELSGGERQAVYVAAALAQEAELLVLDEPTTHLDPPHQARVASLLADLVAGGGHTVLAASHDLTFAALVADRVVGLAAGRVAAAGTPREILHPEVLARLFGARFDLAGSPERPVPVLRLGEAPGFPVPAPLESAESVSQESSPEPVSPRPAASDPASPGPASSTAASSPAAPREPGP
jgi:iron complex transport system ATP-binding protein